MVVTSYNLVSSLIINSLTRSSLDWIEEIRSVSSPKSINPVITGELTGIATERSSATVVERQRVGSHSSGSRDSTAGGGGSGAGVEVVTGKKPRHYLSGTSRCFFVSGCFVWVTVFVLLLDECSVTHVEA